MFSCLSTLAKKRWTFQGDALRYGQHFLSSLANNEDQLMTLPSRAQIVICGGGIVGSSVAYHLPKYGFKDILHLEQGSLGCGTTWHSAGLLGAIRGSHAHTKLTNYSNELYSKLDKESGLGTGIKQTGTLNLATKKGRMDVLRRQQAIGRSLGIESHIVSAKECAQICPLIRTDDVLGALYNSNDVCAGDPSDICRSLSQGSRLQGVKLYEGVRVDGVKVTDGKVSGVMTDKGSIECEIFVNCAGQWARQLGNLSIPKVNVPLHSTEHFYIVTKPFGAVDREMPSVRDHDNQLYIRQWSGGILAGCFELHGKPCFHDGVPTTFEFQLLPEDWDHCQPLIDSIMHRIPAMKDAEIRQMINGPESFTPDLHAIMGEAPEIRNYYIGAGMNSTGIATAGGFGKALSEWIYLGEPPYDLWEFDIARFSPHQANLLYLGKRAKEVLARHYIIPWPNFEMESGRSIKMTPFHTRLNDAGASWGCVSGWERPNWFSGVKNTCRENSHTFNIPNYFENVREEHLNCRENVALFDLSPFVKLEIEGKYALSMIQNVCSNNVDVPIGQVIYTGMLNTQGGYQTDCTVTRLDEQKFLAICPSAQATHMTTWLNKHVKFPAKVEDVTPRYCVLGLMGPKSRELLQMLTKTSLENATFPYGTSQVINIGFASNIRALRVSYVGELGWELHIPVEFALHVFDQLMNVGEEFKLKLAGAYAMDSLRIEKGYRHWSHELDSETSPLEARLLHAVDFKKGDFIGRDALLKQQAEGVTQMLGIFKVTMPERSSILPWGKELIYRNGVCVGYLTSANFGFTIGKPVCMGYVHHSDGKMVTPEYLRSGKYDIEINGTKYSSSLTLKSFYDPNSTKMKA